MVPSLYTQFRQNIAWTRVNTDPIRFHRGTKLRSLGQGPEETLMEDASSRTDYSTTERKALAVSLQGYIVKAHY